MVSVREFSGLLGSRRDAKLPWLAQSAAAAAAAERARRAIGFLAAHGASWRERLVSHRSSRKVANENQIFGVIDGVGERAPGACTGPGRSCHDAPCMNEPIEARPVALRDDLQAGVL